MKCLLALFAVCLLTVSCAVNSPNDTQNEWVTITVGVENCIDGANKIDGFNKGQSMEAIFPLIPGKLFGTPTADIVAYEYARAGEALTLRLPANMSDKAQALSQEGLTITPSNTELLRLGTFHRYANYGDSIGGGLFYDEKTGDFAVLTYFSDAAKVIGTDSNQRETTKIDISIPFAGWHWVAISQVGKNQYAGRLYKGSVDSIKFCAIVKAVGT